MREEFLDGKVALFGGDMIAALHELPDNSVDAGVMDPPYHLTSIVKRFGAEDAAPAKSAGATGVYSRASRGFLGKRWDGGDVAFRVSTWRAVYRVLKPGAHLLVFGHPRTYHRMACAIEDANFEIRDQVQWHFGSGFAKSHDVALDFETTLCERVSRVDEETGREIREWRYLSDGAPMVRGEWRHPLAIEYDGFGTALKPACEPVVLARKPLSEKTVAANVARWGTGALNIEACRIGDSERTYALKGGENLNVIARPGAGDDPGAAGLGAYGVGAKQVTIGQKSVLGRFPANVLHDGSPEVVACYPESDGQLYKVGPEHGPKNSVNVYGDYGPRPEFHPRNDSGSAARFFYAAKADLEDRLGSGHPTVKPIDLLQYLCRLITPKGGVVLDCFAGTGTTAEAAIREGMRSILIEREDEYLDDIRLRMSLILAGPDERAREIVKAAGVVAPVETLPLFSAEVA